MELTCSTGGHFISFNRYRFNLLVRVVVFISPVGILFLFFLCVCVCSRFLSDRCDQR